MRRLAEHLRARCRGIERRAEQAALELGLRHLSHPYAGEMRELMSAWSRREARDRHGMRVLLASTLASDGQAIDVGAHSGAVLSEIMRVAPRGRHIAYEPLPALAVHLRNVFPDVEVREAALSDENGTTSFVHVEAAPEYSGLRERAYPGYEDSPRRTLTVRTERLDDALPDGFAPSLIKIDVEGAELLVLRGAVQTLREHRPVVIFEHGIGASERYGTGPQDVYDLLVPGLGMRIFDLDGTGPYTRAQFIDAFPAPIWNFVAVPR